MMASPAGQQGRSTVSGGQRQHRSLDAMVRSTNAADRLRNEESWVEISSQPSSSSLSSIDNEIITTGLRVRRRRKLQAEETMQGQLPRTASTSSQEEYTESESDDDDHVLTSSNEQIPSFSRAPPVAIERGDLQTSSDDEDGTAVGKATPFTPQPNAFSHPPSSRSQPRDTSGSYFQRVQSRNPSFSTPESHRQSYASRTNASRPQASHTPYSAFNTNHRIDHDEALRASLSTLLSCAAAARGLPRKTGGGNQQASRPEFSGFRLVPESELMGESKALPVPASSSSSCPRSSSTSNASPGPDDRKQSKRKATTSATAARRPQSPQPRVAKKKRTANEEVAVSPTYMTWAVSAGVVVLISVVSIGAGFVIGREVGFEEGVQSASCGTELARTSGELKRFRWGGNNGILV